MFNQIRWKIIPLSTTPFSVVIFSQYRLEFPTVFVVISNNKFDLQYNRNCGYEISDVS
jgi:hypothetical protein